MTMGYSDKSQIGALTSLMRQYGIATVVACPGSRNAPIVHNFQQAGMECHAVTDERSAGFYALGLALAKGAAVAVCVTSGSALLNLAPAVAEAYYRHCAILVISADRPAHRIGQLAGQTLPQPGVFGAMAAYSCTLPEGDDSVSKRYCVRLINEALMELRSCRPVHVNVPISEPLYTFDTCELTTATLIEKVEAPAEEAGYFARWAMDRLDTASQPMVVIGQTSYHPSTSEYIRIISQRHVVIYESLSSVTGGLNLDRLCDEAVPYEHFTPDLVLYVGDTLISNKIKKFLARDVSCRTIGVNIDGAIHDTFFNTAAVIQCSPIDFLAALAQATVAPSCPTPFYNRWGALIDKVKADTETSVPASIEVCAVKALEEVLCGKKVNMHYANSTSARLGNLYTTHYNYVNRGVNGIEGSLSAAAGFSLASTHPTFCVIGDLSFFYDCNALWHEALDGRLRILLLNNGGGEIFSRVEGASLSAAFSPYIRGTHSASAQGICRAYGAHYRCCTDKAELPGLIRWLADTESARPLLLEIKA